MEKHDNIRITNSFAPGLMHPINRWTTTPRDGNTSWMAQLMSKFFCLYLLQLGLVPHSLWAQAPITLDQAEALYLAENPLLEAGKDSIEAAEARHRQAGLRPNPGLNFSQEGLSAGPENASGFNDQEFILWATQRLELGGKRRHRREVAETGIEIGRAELEDLIRRGKAQVKEAYLATVFAQEKATLSRAQLESFYRVKEIHQQRLQAGDVSGLAQMRVDLEELRYLSALNQATTDANSYWSELAALIGWTGSEQPSLVWEPQKLDLTASLEQLQKQALESRPDLVTASLKRKRSFREVGFERAQRIPDVTVVVATKGISEWAPTTLRSTFLFHSSIKTKERFRRH